MAGAAFDGAPTSSLLGASKAKTRHPDSCRHSVYHGRCIRIFTDIGILDDSGGPVADCFGYSGIASTTTAMASKKEAATEINLPPQPVLVIA